MDERMRVEDMSKTTKTLGRRAALNYVARILCDKYGFTIKIHNYEGCNCLWLEIWEDVKAKNIWSGKWIGNLNLTLLGTWYTSNMLGLHRKNILSAIPDEDELIIKANSREKSMSREFDYGFWEDE